MREKQIKTLERVFKGAGNHWRIKILLILAEMPGKSLDEIVNILKSNYQTTAEHTRRLKIAGLIKSRYFGRSVSHILTPYGDKIVKIIKTFLD